MYWLFLGFGLIMVFTASTVVSAELYGSQTWIFTRQLLFVVLGLVTLMVSMKIDYHFYERAHRDLFSGDLEPGAFGFPSLGARIQWSSALDQIRTSQFSTLRIGQTRRCPV